MAQIRTSFGIEKVDPMTYSPLALAYLGDGVFDLVVRTIIVGRANAPAHVLHEKCSQIVMASSQANMFSLVQDELSEEELAVFKRGRNAKPRTIAKHASAHDYRIATGFESLIGFLYLTGRMDRVLWIVKKGLQEQ